MCQCILNVPLSNDWSKVTYSQVHGSPMLKISSFKSLTWICAIIFVELIQLGQDPKLRWPKTFWRENLVFHWRKISYLNFTYIFSLFLLLFFFLLGIHSMQGWTATTRYEVTRKRNTKRLRHTRNMSRKSLTVKRFLLIPNFKPFRSYSKESIL